jgi:hypothetical protein
MVHEGGDILILDSEKPLAASLSALLDRTTIIRNAGPSQSGIPSAVLLLIPRVPLQSSSQGNQKPFIILVKNPQPVPQDLTTSPSPKVEFNQTADAHRLRMPSNSIDDGSGH